MRSIATYLLGGPFPPDALLLLGLLTPAAASPHLERLNLLPASAPTGLKHQWLFAGLHFCLLTGTAAHDYMKAVSLPNSGLALSSSDSIFDDVFRAVRDATPTGKLK